MSFAITRVDSLFEGRVGDEAHGELRAPMPGRIIALLTEPGIAVEKGAPLLVMEAMKMEHTLAAPAAGIVVAFHCAVGDQVTGGAELVQFEAAS